MTNHLNRREAIGILGAATIGFGGLSRAMAGATNETSGTAGHKSLRVAHLTDIHVQPERRANEGLIACLRHVQKQTHKPDLVLTGGDLIFDSLETDDARTALQWDLYRNIFNDECSIDVRHCLGNHDVWGWVKRKSRCTGSEPTYGKKRALDTLGLAAPYSSFNARGGGNRDWHIIILDSTQTDGGEGYIACLDEAQFDWLERDLASLDANTPALVISHIPIMSVTAPLYSERDQTGNATLRNSWVHRDSRRIVELFAKYTNVKVCLSGHLHHLERADYNGVTYLCNGAVSGNWWKGKHYECDEGYAIIDLFDDGTFEHEYYSYGWIADAGQG